MSENKNLCGQCKACGYEPDADYPICYNKDLINHMKTTLENFKRASTAFGIYIIHTWPNCQGKYFEQHPLRGGK